MNTTTATQGFFTLDVHALNKSELKDVHRVLRFMPQPTVGQLRGMLHAGWFTTVIHVIGVVGILLLLALVFWPLVFVAAVAPVMVPIRNRAQNRRWAVLLPAEADAQLVRLAGAAA